MFLYNCIVTRNYITAINFKLTGFEKIRKISQRSREVLGRERCGFFEFFCKETMRNISNFGQEMLWNNSNFGGEKTSNIFRVLVKKDAKIFSILVRKNVTKMKYLVKYHTTKINTNRMLFILVISRHFHRR